MGKRDIRKRETKKPKKGSKKTTPINFEPQANVEIIKKGKKESEDSED
jgi:hypothetical protein